MELSPQVIVALQGTFVVILWLIRYHHNSCRHVLPPSPPRRLPFIGHMFSFPRKDEWQTYRRWGEELDTDIMYMSVLGKHFLVINDYHTAKELLEIRSTQYSGRPSFAMSNELMGWDWPMPTLPCNQKWKRQRRMFFKHLGSASFYQPRILEYVHNILLRLDESPDVISDRFKSMVAGIIFSLAYGIRTSGAAGDSNIGLAQTALDCFLDASKPGKHLVNLIPALKYLPKWLPGVDIQGKAKAGRKLMKQLLEVPFEQARKEIAEGISRPSLISKVFEGLQDGSMDGEPAEEIIQTSKELAAVLFSAGFDTTYASTIHFFRAMAQYPHIQAKIHRELSSVIESERLPQFEDEPRLPYLVATIKEVTRCYPVSSTGIPHMCTEDDVYNGYYIPKNTVVLPNLRMMMADPIAYPEPEKFFPERFLLSSGKLNPSIQDPYSIAFGFGKRMCPGSRIAHSTLFITAATVLSRFEFSAMGKGLEETRSAEVTSNRHPTLGEYTVRRRDVCCRYVGNT